MNRPITHKIEKLSVTRRAALAGLSASSLVLLGACGERKSARDVIRAEATGKTGDAVLEPSVYLGIDETGQVTIQVHRVEMGQGSRTGLPAIIADELDADWDRLILAPAFGDKKFGDQNTDGSTSIRKYYQTFREAGATARAMLQQAAANRLGVPVDQITVENHTLRGPAGEVLDFGDVVADAAELEPPAAESLSFKTPDQWRYVGKPVRNVYMDDIITGAPLYGQDVRVEGMLFAVVARPPVIDAPLQAFDREAALAVNGVRDVITLPSPPLDQALLFQPLGGVAVIADNTWAAIKGRAALATQFGDSASSGFNTEALEQTLWASVGGEDVPARQRGDAAAALAAADRVISADYFVPQQVHAPMEPPAATAFYEDGKLTIKTSCQDPQTVQQAVGAVMGIEPADIYVETTVLGGAFGRKSKPDFACEAALLAKATGKPVKVVWTREDEVQHGYYHTMTTQRVRVGLDGDGAVTAWQHKSVFPTISYIFNRGAEHPSMSELGLGLTDLPFDIPNLDIATGKAPHHLRYGWLRSVCNIQHAFAIGAVVDEIAEVRGVSGLQAWMDLIGDDRMVNPGDDGTEYGNYGDTLERFPIDTARLKATLAKAAEMADYDAERPEGVGVGIAVHRSFVSYVACALEVDTRGGQPKVTRAWMAIDCGLAVNPDRVAAQMEGAVVFTLSVALHGEITAQNGRIDQQNYDGYPICRMDECPETEVAIIPSDALPGGVGEPGVPPVTPALTSAIFAANGTRIRRLPVRDQWRGNA